jgi:hypothetical protein
MAQKTAWDGATLTESDINTYLMGEGGAWSTWTPTLTQSGAVTKTVTRAVYARYGRTIHFNAQLAVTGSGTSSNSVTISLPVTAASAGFITIGGGYIYDATASLNYHGLAYLLSTTTMALSPSAVGVGLGVLGTVSFTAALANGDSVNISGTYEAAS